MEQNHSARTRLSKTIIASIAGFALLLGGSTYALWSATDTSSSSATISTGDLKVTASSPESWSDVTDSANPVTIDLSTYRLSPRSTIQLKQDLSVVVVGDNISGILEVHVPNNTLSTPLMEQAVFSLSLLNKSGLEIGSQTASLNTSGSLALVTSNLTPTVAAGELYTVKLSVTLPSTADNLTKLQVANLGDMSITLTQGPKLAAEDLVPPVIQTASFAAGKVGSVYEKSLDVTGHPIVSIDSGALPGGMALDKTAYKIAGTPTEMGTFDFSVKAVNPTGSTSKAYQLKIGSAIEVSRISLGDAHSLALDTNGHLWAWGYNGNGQFGNGSTTNSSSAIAITPTKTYSQISAKGQLSLALDTSGHLWSWGSNANGELGNGGTTSSPSPIAITPTKTYSQISAGVSYALAIDSSGHLWSWGSNFYGQLGNGSASGGSVLSPVAINPGQTFSQISAGQTISTALDTNGKLYSWGQFSGNGTNTQMNSPVAITPTKTYTKISSGPQFVLALDSSNQLWGWGYGASGQLGSGSSPTWTWSPTLIASGKTFSKISAGSQSSLALDSTGHLWAWGLNTSGQLGNGTSAKSPSPIAVNPANTYSEIFTGEYFSMALDSANDLWSWGANESGQLGDGTLVTKYSPIKVPMPSS